MASSTNSWVVLRETQESLGEHHTTQLWHGRYAKLRARFDPVTKALVVKYPSQKEEEGLSPLKWEDQNADETSEGGSTTMTELYVARRRRTCSIWTRLLGRLQDAKRLLTRSVHCHSIFRSQLCIQNLNHHRSPRARKTHR